MNKDLEREYIVEKILEKKKFKNEYKYKVKWLGYPESESTWEPVSHLSKCLDLIEEYEKNQNKKSENDKGKTEEKKLIGKKRKNKLDEEEEKLSEKKLKSKKEIDDTFSENLNKNNSNIAKSSDGNDQPNKINSLNSSFSEQKTKELSLKSPDRFKHIETVNNEFRESEMISSPRILTRTMLRKNEDDKIIENVFEKKESDFVENKTPKSFKIEGDLEYDTPLIILDARQHKEKDDEILCLVEWSVRKDGTKPGNSYYINKELKKKFPMLLCEFYESRLKFPSKKNK